MASNPMVSVEFEASVGNLQAGLSNVQRSVADAARAMVGSWQQVNPAVRQVETGFGSVSKALMSWRREATQEARTAAFFAAQIGQIGIMSKEAGGALAQLASGFAFGGAAGIGIEIVKMIAGGLVAARNEARKAAEDLKKAGAEASGAWIEFARSVDKASAARAVYNKVALAKEDEREQAARRQTELKDEIVRLDTIIERESERKRLAAEKIAGGSALSPEEERGLAAVGRLQQKLDKAKGDLERLNERYPGLDSFVETQKAALAEAEKVAQKSKVGEIIEKQGAATVEMEQAHKVAMLEISASLMTEREKIVEEGEAKILAIQKKYIGAASAERQRAVAQEVAAERAVTAERLRRFDRGKQSSFSETMDAFSQAEIDVFKPEQHKGAELNFKSSMKDMEEMKKRMEEMKAAARSMAATFADAFMDMATGAKSVGDVMKELLLGFLRTLVQMVFEKIALGIVEQFAEKAKGMGLIATSAGVAGAEAAAQVASTPAFASAPFVGAAIAAEVQAMGMGFLASAAGGFDIPAGVSPIARLHEKEMVLPAPIAQGFREMIAAGSSGGDTYQVSISAVDARSVERLFRDNPGAILRSLSRAKRAGRRA